MRETWRAWKPVEQVHTPEWRQIGLGIGKTITGIIGSIRKLATEYFDIYGRNVKLDAAAISGGSMSSGNATDEPNEITDLRGP